MEEFKAPAPGKTWLRSAPAPGSSSSSSSGSLVLRINYLTVFKLISSKPYLNAKSRFLKFNMRCDPLSCS